MTHLLSAQPTVRPGIPAQTFKSDVSLWYITSVVPTLVLLNPTRIATDNANEFRAVADS